MAGQEPGASTPPEPETCSVEEAARRLKMGRTRAYQLIALDQFPVEPVRIGARTDGTGGLVRIPVAKLDVLLGERPPLDAPTPVDVDRAALLDALRAVLPTALADALPAAFREIFAREAAR